MKKLLLGALVTFSLSSIVLATSIVDSSAMGIYFGLQGGWGTDHWKIYDGYREYNKKGELFNNSVNKDNGLVGRAFLGMDINKYLAIETGYTHFFNDDKVKINGAKKFNLKTYSFDLLLKGKLPISTTFQPYAKLVAAYLTTDYDTDKRNATNISMAHGAGIDYYITANVIANIEWLHVSGNHKLTDLDFQPNTDAFMIGLRYKIQI